VIRKPLHLPVRNERITIPAPAASNIQPRNTTDSMVVATAAYEATAPSNTKNTPRAKYHHRF